MGQPIDTSIFDHKDLLLLLYFFHASLRVLIYLLGMGELGDGAVPERRIKGLECLPSFGGPRVDPQQHTVS